MINVIHFFYNLFTNGYSMRPKYTNWKQSVLHINVSEKNRF